MCVICKPQERGGHGPRWAAAPQEKKIFQKMLRAAVKVGTFDIWLMLLAQLYRLHCLFRRNVRSPAVLNVPYASSLRSKWDDEEPRKVIDEEYVINYYRDA